MQLSVAACFDGRKIAQRQLASRNTRPWDVSGTKPENAISRFLHFKDLSSLKMLASMCQANARRVRTDNFDNKTESRLEGFCSDFHNKLLMPEIDSMCYRTADIRIESVGEKTCVFIKRALVSIDVVDSWNGGNAQRFLQSRGELDSHRQIEFSWEAHNRNNALKKGLRMVWNR